MGQGLETKERHTAVRFTQVRPRTPAPAFQAFLPSSSRSCSWLGTGRWSHHCVASSPCFPPLTTASAQRLRFH